MTYACKSSAFILMVSTILTFSAQSALAGTLSSSPDTSLRNRTEPATESVSTTGIQTPDGPQPSVLPTVPDENASATLTPITDAVDPGSQSAPTNAPASKAPHKHYLRNLLIILGIGIALPLTLLVTTDK